MNAMHILIDSLNCNPHTGSNAESGYGFVVQALKRNRVSLLTHRDLFHEGGNDLESLGGERLRVYGLRPGAFRKLGRQSDYLLRCYFHARRIVRADRPDIVHTVEPNQYRLVRPLSLLRGVPFVIGPLNGGDAYPPREFLDSIGSRYERVFGSAPPGRRGIGALADRLNFSLVHGAIARMSTMTAFRRARRIVIGTRNCLNNIPVYFHGKCRPVPCFGVDTAQFRPEDNAARPGRSILYAGRITEYKAVDFLIHAFARLRATPGLRLDIVGTGRGNAADEQFERYCRGLAGELGVSDTVVFHGQIPRARMREFYCGCDVFCLPSLWEPLGMVYVEAMACGRPVVAMDSGGPAELIDDSFGVKVRPRIMEQFIGDLARALQELLTDRERRRAMGEQARKFVERNFAWDSVGERMQRVYEEVLAEKRP